MKKKPKTMTLAKIRRAQSAVALAAKTLAEIIILDNTGHQLAICVKALRGIASSPSTDNHSRGLARAALKHAGF